MKYKKRAFNWITVFLLAFIPSLSLAESSLVKDEKRHQELTSGLDERLAKIHQVKSRRAKLDELQSLERWLKSEKASAREELNKVEAGGTSADQEKAFARDTETLRLWFSFEPVFKRMLTDKFSAVSSVRTRACTELPKTIRFAELANLPEGAKLSDYREKAVSAVKDICGAK